MSATISAKVKIINGRLLTRANMANIVAKSTVLTDPWGNSIPSPIERFKNHPGLFREYRICKEPEGYIFRSNTGSSGINGHHKSIRKLVLATLLGCPRIRVEVTE